MKRKIKKVSVFKAKSISHAKHGYFIMRGTYPYTQMKYFKNKRLVLKQKKKWEK